MIILASSREDLRGRWLPLLSTGEIAVATADDWAGLLGLMSSSRARLVIVDPALVGLPATMLAPLAASLPHRPLVRAVEGTLEGVPSIPQRSAAVAALLRRFRRPATEDLHARLRWCGLGDRAAERVAVAAGHDRPVVLVGERGTGKEFVARAIHALSRPGEPFTVLGPESPWPIHAAGTLYVESAHTRQGLADRVTAGGARVMASARAQGAAVLLAGADVMLLTPLRERPQHLLPLVQHYLASHSRRLGGGRRRFDRSLLALLTAWPWPGNERELERFVVEVLDQTTEPLVRARALPEALLQRLDPSVGVAGSGIEGFEEVVAARLAPVLERWHEGRGTDLHALVSQACDRALLRLALARTRGNRKAAARLLGIARNTLQSDLERLGLSVGSGSPREDPRTSR